MVRLSTADDEAYRALAAEVLRLYFRGLTAAQIATDLHQPRDKITYILSARYLRSDSNGRRRTRAASPDRLGWDNSIDVDPDWDQL